MGHIDPKPFVQIVLYRVGFGIAVGLAMSIILWLSYVWVF